MTVSVIDPPRYFEVKGEVCELKAAAVSLSTGNNQTVVAAVSGYQHRVMGYKAQGNGGVSSLLLESSGGTALTPAFVIPDGAAGAFDELPVIDSGYFATLSGEGLRADVATNPIRLLVFYITHKA